MPRTVSYKRVTSSVTESSIGTSWVELLEASDSSNIDITTLIIANRHNSSNVSIKLSITSGATNGTGSGGTLKAYLCYNTEILLGDSLSFSDEVIHLDKNDQLWILSNVASSLSVYARIIKEVKTITQT